MDQTIDCRGLSCPAPVLAAKKEINKKNPDSLTVLVDNRAAAENVTRFLNTSGYKVSVQEADGNLTVSSLREGPGASSAPLPEPSAGTRKIIVIVTSDTMGRGDDTLGSALMANFLKTLKEMGNELWQLIFLNNGVKLTVEGSPVLDPLTDLAKDGIAILVCGTCLNHFHLLDRKKVGETTNMLDIVAAMQAADSVVTL